MKKKDEGQGSSSPSPMDACLESYQTQPAASKTLSISHSHWVVRRLQGENKKPRMEDALAAQKKRCPAAGDAGIVDP